MQEGAFILVLLALFEKNFWHGFAYICVAAFLIAADAIAGALKKPSES